MPRHVLDSEFTDIVTSIEKFPLIIPEVDDSPRLQRAVDSMTGKGGTVFLPKVLYNVNSQVNVNIDNVTIKGNGFSTIVQTNQDNNIFYVTGHYVSIEDIKLKTTATTRTKFTVECFGTNKTEFNKVYFDNTGNSLSGLWFNGGSMGVVDGCMFNHTRLLIHTWDVKVDKTFLWALSQDYGICIAKGAGNTTLTNVDVVPPFKTLVTRKAGIWLDSTDGTVSNTKLIGVYFDGNPTLDTGIGLLISPNTWLVTLSDFSANKMDDDVIVIDSAFSVTVERGMFHGDNNKGTGAREIFIKKTGVQPLSNINIRNNQFVLTEAITGTLAPAIEVDSSVGSQAGIKIEFNDIKQPSAGGGYTEPEILVDGTTIGSLRGNSGTLSKYFNKRGNMAIASGATGATISSLGGTYPLAYEAPIGSYKINSEGFIMPNYRIQKVNRNSIFIAFETAAPAAGTLHWNVEL